MGAKHYVAADASERRQMADVPCLIVFVVLMITYIGVAVYAILNGQLANSLTYIHNLINHDERVDSTAKMIVQILDDLSAARFMILLCTFLAILWSILIVFIIRTTTKFVIFIGIICELTLLIALFVVTIFISQSRMYQHSSANPYLFFPLFIVIFVLKLLAAKEVGSQFLSNIVCEACRVITNYWFGFLMMFFINVLALSSVIFGFYITCQLTSTSLNPLYTEVQTEDGSSLEISNFVITTIPFYIYLFHMINFISFVWLNRTLWYFGYVMCSQSFADLYQNPEENCNSIRAILGKSKTIMRYHIGTVIYAASPCAFIVNISAMWKHAFNSTNEYLKQKPFLGSISWLETVWNLSGTAMIFCSVHKTAFKQSAKLASRIFIHNPIRLLTMYSVLGWLCLFTVTFVTLATLTVFRIYIAFVNEPPLMGIISFVVVFGAIAMAGTVCQLFKVAVLSIYVIMAQNIERVSDVESKKPVNPAIERITAYQHIQYI